MPILLVHSGTSRLSPLDSSDQKSVCMPTSPGSLGIRAESKPSRSPKFPSNAEDLPFARLPVVGKMGSSRGGEVSDAVLPYLRFETGLYLVGGLIFTGP